jgi:hypothetical protein
MSASTIVKIQRPADGAHDGPWLVSSQDVRIMLMVPEACFSKRVRAIINLTGHGYFRATVHDGKIDVDGNGLYRINTHLVKRKFKW